MSIRGTEFFPPPYLIPSPRLVFVWKTLQSSYKYPPRYPYMVFFHRTPLLLCLTLLIFMSIRPCLTPTLLTWDIGPCRRQVQNTSIEAERQRAPEMSLISLPPPSSFSISIYLLLALPSSFVIALYDMRCFITSNILCYW